MTRNEAIKKCRRQWTLLRDNPTRSKEWAIEQLGDYPKFIAYSSSSGNSAYCYLCEYFLIQTNIGCIECPLSNGKDIGCAIVREPYYIWCNTNDPRIKYKAAQALLDKLNEVKHEPEQGDVYTITDPGLFYNGYVLVSKIHVGVVHSEISLILLDNKAENWTFVMDASFKKLDEENYIGKFEEVFLRK